jgi:hypothetical protein
MDSKQTNGILYFPAADIVQQQTKFFIDILIEI